MVRAEDTTSQGALLKPAIKATGLTPRKIDDALGLEPGTTLRFQDNIDAIGSTLPALAEYLGLDAANIEQLGAASDALATEITARKVARKQEIALAEARSEAMHAGGRKLKALRGEMTRKELAPALGIDIKQLMALEDGIKPIPADLVDTIQTALGLEQGQVDQLLTAIERASLTDAQLKAELGKANGAVAAPTRRPAAPAAEPVSAPAAEEDEWAAIIRRGEARRAAKETGGGARGQ